MNADARGLGKKRRVSNAARRNRCSIPSRAHWLSHLRASAFICGSIICAACFAQSVSITPAGEAFANKVQLQPFAQALAQGSWVDAAERAEALLAEGVDRQFAVEGGASISVRAWMESLPSNQQLAVMPEVDKLIGESAKQSLESMQARPNRRPEDFVAIATTYPLSTTARDAWAAATLRAIDLGDVSVVGLYQQRARALGWKPTTSQQQQIDAATKYAFAPASPVVFPSPWHGQFPPVLARKVLPVSGGGLVFFCTEKHVIAAKENGELAWQWAAPKSDPAMPGIRNGLHRPAVLCDRAGQPQIVIARQVISGTRFGCLRAFRAADGKLLWSSESNAAMGNWSLASLPIAAGRATWVLAIDETIRPAPVAMIALETATGKLLSTLAIGSFATLTDSKEPGSFKEVDALWSHSGPAIDGADIFIATSRGLVARIDRLDGHVRWTRSYASVPSPGEEIMALTAAAVRGDNPSRAAMRAKADQLRERLKAIDVRTTGRPTQALPDDVVQLAELFAQPTRWLSTPAAGKDVLVIAATDHPGVIGVNRNTGAQVWQRDADLSDYTLLGISGEVAVLAGEKMVGLHLRDGTTKWTWASPDGKQIDSPPMLVGKNILVQSAGKTVAIDAASGTLDAAAPAGLSVRALLANEQTRSTLSAADILSSISPAPNKPADPKRK